MQLAERYTPGGVSNLMLVGGTQQVMLQVRFAEMQRTVRQELSTSLGVQTGDVGFGTNALSTVPRTDDPDSWSDWRRRRPNRRPVHRLRLGLRTDRHPRRSP
jgi:hypothetical protein